MNGKKAGLTRKIGRWFGDYLSCLWRYQERNLPIDLSSGEVDPMEER